MVQALLVCLPGLWTTVGCRHSPNHTADDTGGCPFVLSSCFDLSRCAVCQNCTKFLPDATTTHETSAARRFRLNLLPTQLCSGLRYSSMRNSCSSQSNRPNELDGWIVGLSIPLFSSTHTLPLVCLFVCLFSCCLVSVCFLLLSSYQGTLLLPFIVVVVVVRVGVCVYVDRQFP